MKFGEAMPAGDLDTYRDSIGMALDVYQQRSRGLIKFKTKDASRLRYVDGKPTPRSQTEVTYRGKPIGDLYVLGIAPGQGSGDNNTYPEGSLCLDHATQRLEAMERQHQIMLYPRNKNGIHAEVALPLLSERIVPERGSSRVMFAGHLSLLGVSSGAVVPIAELGQTIAEYDPLMSHCDFVYRQVNPQAVLTVGHHGELASDDTQPFFTSYGERFGGEHAIFNGHPLTRQFWGFLAITDSVATEVGVEPLNALNAIKPVLL